MPPRWGVSENRGELVGEVMRVEGFPLCFKVFGQRLLREREGCCLSDASAGTSNPSYIMFCVCGNPR